MEAEVLFVWTLAALAGVGGAVCVVKALAEMLEAA